MHVVAAVMLAWLSGIAPTEEIVKDIEIAVHVFF